MPGGAPRPRVGGQVRRPICRRAARSCDPAGSHGPGTNRAAFWKPAQRMLRAADLGEQGARAVPGRLDRVGVVLARGRELGQLPGGVADHRGDLGEGVDGEGDLGGALLLDQRDGDVDVVGEAGGRGSRAAPHRGRGAQHVHVGGRPHEPLDLVQDPPVDDAERGLLGTDARGRRRLDACERVVETAARVAEGARPSCCSRLRACVVVAGRREQATGPGEGVGEVGQGGQCLARSAVVGLREPGTGRIVAGHPGGPREPRGEGLGEQRAGVVGRQAGVRRPREPAALHCDPHGHQPSRHAVPPARGPRRSVDSRATPTRRDRGTIGPCQPATSYAGPGSRP